MLWPRQASFGDGPLMFYKKDFYTSQNKLKYVNSIGQTLND